MSLIYFVYLPSLIDFQPYSAVEDPAADTVFIHVQQTPQIHHLVAENPTADTTIQIHLSSTTSRRSFRSKLWQMNMHDSYTSLGK